mmetsp:Transcript_12324/g.17192  ORF Transcript_12324/g.17192 Transcript_12324/m.17192 type:complete len:239 (-) Transcript_12324:700-1416(-)
MSTKSPFLRPDGAIDPVLLHLYIVKKKLGINIFGIFLIGFRDRKSLVLGFGISSTTEERRVSLDDDEGTAEGRAKNAATHHKEGIIVVQLAESHSESNCTDVTPGTHNTSNGSSARRVDIRHNTVGGSLSSLDEDREENHDNNGPGKRVGVSKDKHKTSLNGQEECLDHNTAAHSHSGVHVVTRESSKTTSEEVHPSKNRSDSSGTLGTLIEFFLEVESSSVVHGKLNSKAAGVLKEE